MVSNYAQSNTQITDPNYAQSLLRTGQAKNFLWLAHYFDIHHFNLSFLSGFRFSRKRLASAASLEKVSVFKQCLMIKILAVNHSVSSVTDLMEERSEACCSKC